MNEQASAAPIVPAREITGERIAAAVIDIVLLGVLFFVMSAIFGDASSSSGDDGSSFSANLDGMPMLIYIVIVFGYYYFMELKLGQTLGKMVLKIKVVTVDGQPLTPQKAGLRTILRIVDGLPFLYLVGFIAMVSSKQKQRIGDMAAGTLVVKA